jgi:two-component system, OmpR family, phosphate regulon sensor histidine kinase PhoR
VIWDRWRRAAKPGADLPPLRPFEDVVEEAPVIALLVDGRMQVLAANAAARAFFSIEADRLPAGLVEVTREGRLVELLRAGQAENEARLVHRGRVVSSRLVPGPRSGETLMFLLDVTELRRLATVRQEFVANLAHELKTPLTALRLAVEGLAGDLPEEARKRLAERAVRETVHLDAILDNLRRLAEIESGAVTLNRSEVDVRRLVEEALDRLQFQRAIDLDIPDDLAVEADPTALAQVLSNLLDNAAKFSPAGAAVEISAENSGSEIVIKVRDHGPGLSPEHWERVFERFYKVDPARSRETGGSGLGLSITRHLVLAQGGRIWTEAAADGGQVFAIALPVNNR